MSGSLSPRLGHGLFLALVALTALCLGAAAPAAAAKAPPVAAASPVADKWAVVVGISEFADPKVPALKFAAKDAKDFYEYLIDPGAGRFARDHVRLLLNQDATKVNIMDAIGDSFLPHAANPDDLVVIYLSTHGSPAGADIRGVNYIVAHDTQVNKLFATGIEMKQLMRVIQERVHTKRILLVMDTCYSGAGAHAGHKGLTRSNVNAEEIAQGIGSVVITSSSPDQRAWESDSLKNSYFTRYLLDALREGQGKVTLDKAFNAMRQRVQAEVLRDKGELQTPVMSGAFVGPALVLGVPPTVVRAAPLSVVTQPAATAEPGRILPTGGDLAGYAQHMRLANKLIEQHKLWDAIHELEKASQINPASVEAQIVACDVYNAQGRYKEMMESAKRAVLNDQQSSRARERLGLAYLRNGQADEALRQAEKAVSLDPTNSMAHNLLGYIQQTKFNRIDQAEQEYRKALELNPLNVRALVNLGLLLSGQRRNLEEAEKYFRKAIEADSDDWEAHLALGCLLYQHKGAAAEAESELRKAIQADPANARLHSELGVILALDKSRYEEAETEFRKGVELAPTSAAAHHLLANFLMERVGRIDEAEREFRKAVELDGNLDDARVGLGNLLVSYRKIYDEADSQFRKALAIAPKNAAARVGLALIYADLYKNYTGAEGELRKALQLDPHYWLAHDRLGLLLSTHFRRFDEAKLEFQRAIQSSPNSALPRYHLGKLLAEQYKAYDEALKQFQKALELDPNDSHIHTTLGWLLTSQYKKHKEAEGEFRKAIELNVADAEAHYRLGLLLIERMGSRRAGEAELRKAHDQQPDNPEFGKAFERYCR